MEPNRKWLSVLMVLLIIAAVASTIISAVAAQASATRILPPSVAAGKAFKVKIVVGGYGMFGQVIETLPNGFRYVNSSIDASVEGQTVKFTLCGEPGFTYYVTASSIEDTYTFSGILKDSQKKEYDVGGAKEIAVKSILITFIPPTPVNGTEIPVNYVNITVFVKAFLNPISTVWLNWSETEQYNMATFMEGMYFYNVTDLPNGEYSYRVYANDTAGNLGMSEIRVVTVNVREFNPWSYDTNGNGKIDVEEVIDAIRDYFKGKITMEQVIEVINLYFEA